MELEQIKAQPGAPATRLSAWLPSRGSTILFLLVMLIMVWDSKTGALAPTTPQAPAANSTAIIPYQGRLSDREGHSINRTLPMIFRLWTAQTGGDKLWEETWGSVQVTNGLFNVQLGSITDFPADLFTTDADLWLEIKVGSDAEMTPRVQLGAAPFAMNSMNGVKAAVFANCTEGSSSASPAKDSVNNVNSNPITITDGTDGAGTCVIDFGFAVDSRYIVATAVTNQPGFHARGVTILEISGNTVKFGRWVMSSSAVGVNGDIMVLVY